MIIYSDHVVLRIKQRSLSRRQIRSTIKKPESTSPSFKGRHIAKKCFGSRVLEVIYKPTDDGIVVITAYWLKEIK